jgi:formylglycine-generating enzyme required for sulfatase activity
MDDRVRALEGALAQDDPVDRRALLKAPGTLQLTVKPDAVAMTLERYRREPMTKRRVPEPLPPPSVGETSLPAGSYRLSLRAPDGAQVFVPFEIQRGRRSVIDVTVPAASAIPADFAYVPAGEFWFGERDEKLRTEFFHTVPIHRRRTGAYFIARHETTFREWTTFVSTLPPRQRDRYLPTSSSGLYDNVIHLRSLGSGWELTFDVTSHRYTVRSGDVLQYVGRKTRARQQWLDFPVSGISVAQITPYLQWLARTKRVPGAHLCTELEWERAARGADDRLYPPGDDLEKDDANIDVTYGRVNSAFGPDVVGSHPASRSPFGVDDLAGNVWELAEPSVSSDQLILKGGGFYYAASSARATNREGVPRGFSQGAVGFRVCASAP